MKTMKYLLLALMLGVGALTSNAAVIHNLTLANDAPQTVTFVDAYWNFFNWESTRYEVDIFIQDDGEGYVNYRYYNQYGQYGNVDYVVDANAVNWTLVSSCSTWFTQAEVDVLNYLYPPF